MSVRRLKVGFGFDCDAIGCDETWDPPHKFGLGSDHPSFIDCWTTAKSEGWKSRTTGEFDKNGRPEWAHRCPGCRFDGQPRSTTKSTTARRG